MLRLLVALLLMLPALAQAQTVSRALLVGVSNYPKEAVGNLQLAGPKNDIALMLDTMPLLGIRPEHIRVLADSLEQTTATRKADGMPTRAAILDGLAKLAMESQRGDSALVYLSGHGSRQPDLTPEKRAVPKADGMDEVFLPIDIGAWESDREKVENALTDFEFGQAIQAIRAKGAHVWVIVDACHSGTMTRSSGDAVIKQVPTEALKVPQSAIDKARAMALARADAARAAAGLPKTRNVGALTEKTRSLWTGEARPADGSYVAFFAAHPDERARQENLPKDAEAADRLPRSVMTWHLIRALRSGQAATYRDLGFYVLQGYEQLSGESPVPMFEGDLTRPVIGASSGSERRYLAQNTDRGMELAAGAVDGVTAGTVLSIAMPDAPDKVVGYGVVEAPRLAGSTLKLTARDGVEAKPGDFRKGMPLVARIVEKGVALGFTVGVAARGSTSSEAEQAAHAALDEIGKSDTGAYRLVAQDQPADLYVAIEDGRLWFLPPGEALVKTGRRRTASVALPRQLHQMRSHIETNLARYAKVRNLTRIGGALSAASLKDKLNIEAFLVRDAGTVPANARAPDDRSCRRPQPEIPDNAEPIDGGVAGIGNLTLRHCDRVYFRLTNLGDKPIDITPLYVDGDAMTSYRAGEVGMRLEPKSVPTIINLGVVTYSQRRGEPEAIGNERMMFIAVEVPDKQALPADYRMLADDVPLTRTTLGGPPALRDFLNATARAQPKTRSAVSAPALGDGVAAGVIEYRWRVAAPEGVD